MRLGSSSFTTPKTGVRIRREGAVMHLGGSDNEYQEDKGHCYTTARKVCSDSLAELLGWARGENYSVRNCKHYDTSQFPFPVTV